jgi:hypothetical protein
VGFQPQRDLRGAIIGVSIGVCVDAAGRLERVPPHRAALTDAGRAALAVPSSDEEEADDFVDGAQAELFARAEADRIHALSVEGSVA